MKVFLSSVIIGFEPFREAAAEAIASLGHVVVRSEQFAASPASPQIACLAGIRESDAVVVLLGQRYGTVQRSGLSATHEEFREARDTKPTLVFTQSGIAAEPDQKNVIDEAREWSQGALSASFATPSELTRAVVRGLHEFELAQVAGGVDQQGMLDRALALMPDQRNASPAPSLALIVVGGPRQSIMRPSELEDDNLGRWLSSQVLFGPHAFLSASEGTTHGVSGNTLVVKQASGWFGIDAEGTTVGVAPIAAAPGDRMGLRPIITEEVTDGLQRLLSFADEVLTRVDPTHRLSTVVPVGALLGAGYGSWRTRAEHASNPNTMNLNIEGSQRPIARLSPPGLARQAFHQRADAIAQDLTVLLRRAAVRR